MADDNVEQGYGQHETKLSGLSDHELYSMYRGESWSKLGEDQRQQLLQETANRFSKENGMIGSCEVVFADGMKPNESGYQSGSVIYLNRSHFVEETAVKNYNGKEVTYKLEDANMRAMTTVFHESIHAWQSQVIDGTIPCSSEERAKEYKANDFNISLIEDGKGGVKAGSQYLSGELPGDTGYFLYYLQSTERDAFRLSEARTEYLMNYLTKKYGDEKSFQEYRKELNVNGYQANLNQAKQFFKNENVEKEINQTLMNLYYGTDVPVDPKIEQLVKAEMMLSYNSMYQDNTVKEEKNMAIDWKNLTVSREEYDKSLRDTVNAYYAHARNDPSMTKDEAIQSTAEVAENYENAMMEFDEAASAQEGFSQSAESDGIDGGGIDGGDDGGMDGGGIE